MFVVGYELLYKKYAILMAFFFYADIYLPIKNFRHVKFDYTKNISYACMLPGIL